MGAMLLDHRYLVSSLVSATADARRFAGCHVGLDAPVRIVELRPPDLSRAGLESAAWDATRCASLVARAAALHHPALPRVRDCFCAGGTCYVVEDAPDGERLAARLARLPVPGSDLRTALRDGLYLCDAVARVAADVPEMLACLVIAGGTLTFDAGGMPRLATWDYACWHGGRGTLDPGTPDLRAPELLAGSHSAPDERAHVYSIAVLLTLLLTGGAGLSAAAREDDLPAPVRAALEPALRADPRQRTPTADALGRALAHAVRATLRALGPTVVAVSEPARQPTPVAEPRARLAALPQASRAPRPRLAQPRAASTVEHARRTAPRAIRQARERSRAAVEAALRRAGRALSGTSCA